MAVVPPDRDPLAGTEAGLDVAPRLDGSVPTGMKPMQNYRLSSSAFTGRAPRSMRDAFGCDQNDRVHPMPDANKTSVRDFLAAIGQVFARVFGR